MARCRSPLSLVQGCKSACSVGPGRRTAARLPRHRSVPAAAFFQPLGSQLSTLHFKNILQLPLVNPTPVVLSWLLFLDTLSSSPWFLPRVFLRAKHQPWLPPSPRRSRSPHTRILPKSSTPAHMSWVRRPGTHLSLLGASRTALTPSHTSGPSPQRYRLQQLSTTLSLRYASALPLTALGGVVWLRMWKTFQQWSSIYGALAKKRSS